jgi:hypothetical protein
MLLGSLGTSFASDVKMSASAPGMFSKREMVLDEILSADRNNLTSIL